MKKIEVNYETGESIEVDLTEEEIRQVKETEAIYLATKPHPLLIEIAKIEASITPRMIRDAALGNTKRLEEKEAELNILRMKLKIEKESKNV